MAKINVWAISDTHDQHEKLVIPTGINVVICTGDAASVQNVVYNNNSALKFFQWFNDLPIKRKIFIPGNHDTAYSAGLINENDFPEVEFIVDKAFLLNGKKAYGSPYTTAFGTGWVYNMRPGHEEAHWKIIPDDTQLLWTHGPAYNTLDATGFSGDFHVGCKALKNRIKKLYDLELHVFGHIHTEFNIPNAGIFMEHRITYVNASVVDLRHRLINNGIVIRI